MPALTPKKVLLVEPDMSRQTEILNVLRAINYDVTASGSQKEGLATISKDSPDLMLVSVDEGADAADLSKKIRKVSPVQRLPLVLMSTSKEVGQRLNQANQKTHFDAFIPLPAALEDIVDWVERLIGLPPPPNGTVQTGSPHVTSSKVREGDQAQIRELKREIEALQEQVHFYQHQLDQLSVVGEKETHELDQVLRDLQEDLDRTKKENDRIREELQLLKGSLAEKDRQGIEKEQMVQRLQAELDRGKTQLQEEMEGLRGVLHETKEQHKKAQNALRDYYKAKMDKQLKRESTIRGMEAHVAEVSGELANLRTENQKVAAERDDLRQKYAKLSEDIERFLMEREKLRQELATEQQKAKKAKETLAALSKALE